MALGRKTGGKNFKKGVVTNPNGRPRITDEVKKARKLTQVEFERACGKLLFMSTEELHKVMNSEKTPVMEALIAKILYKGIKESSRIELNYFVERFLGKVPDNLNVEGSLNSDLTAFIAGRKKSEDDE